MTRIAAGMLAVVLAFAGFADTGARQVAGVPVPAVKAEKGEACVAPTAEMRRNHMKMLFHQRDRTMREGVRAPRFSLKGCVECHAGRQSGSVLGEKGFCSSCHEYAAVKIDCFECHTPMRQTKAASSR